MEHSIIGLGDTGLATTEVLSRLVNKVRVYDVNLSRQQELDELGYSPLRQAKEGSPSFACQNRTSKRPRSVPREVSTRVVRSSTRPSEVQRRQDEYGHHIVHMPEFLREATPLWEALTTSHIVIGECCPNHG